jgi:hypothetical protein
MLTFNRVCKELGLEPNAVRMILKSGQPYKIRIIPNNPINKNEAKELKGGIKNG